MLRVDCGWATPDSAKRKGDQVTLATAYFTRTTFADLPIEYGRRNRGQPTQRAFLNFPLRDVQNSFKGQAQTLTLNELYRQLNKDGVYRKGSNEPAITIVATGAGTSAQATFEAPEGVARKNLVSDLQQKLPELSKAFRP